MTIRNLLQAGAVLGPVGALLLWGCGMSEDAASTGSPGAADDDWGAPDSDADSDSDSDSDADADADSDADGEGDYGPVQEDELKALVPQGAGRYVFIADERRDAVVLVDSETLEIRTVEVGSRPTHLVTLPTEGEDEAAVAVINLNSDDVTVIRMDGDGEIGTVDIPVRPDTNALAPSPDGRYIIAYHDPVFTKLSGAPSTDQDISILDLSPGKEASYAQTVGMHPWKVIYAEDGRRAFVVSEGGINPVNLETLGEEPPAPHVALFESGSYDSLTADIEIIPDGSMAIGRKAGSAMLVVASLDDSGDSRQYALPAVPTDLDVAEDGSFGMMVFPSLESVAFFDLPLPEDTESDPFTLVSLEGRAADLASLSGDGDRVVLYAAEAPELEARRRLTFMDRDGDDWRISSALLERPIDKVATVDNEKGVASAAMVLHDKVATGADEKPYGYTLVTLPGLMTKLQQLAAEPGQVLLLPDGAYGFLLLPETHQVEKVDMGTLIVDRVPLSSVPVTAGYAAATDKVFVAQVHDAGRMTFIGVADDSVKTVTGYNLNEDIEVSQ